MTLDLYSKLAFGCIGITPDTDTLVSADGPSLPVCIAGKIENKSKTLFKPKIPKSGKSIYESIYIRKVKSFNYLYDFNTSIFIVSLHISKDPRDWINKRLLEIRRRVNEFKK